LEKSNTSMIIYRYLLLFFCYIFFLHQTFAQTFYQQEFPKNYFRFPLDIPMSLAANFGECRTDHFHMGLDIRTNQKENYPVYAAAEGYISKIYINKSGFGRAIYIRHPNGYTTLYAHLNTFYPALQQYVEKKQYADQQWEQDFTLNPNQFPVHKGELIAYSGNTGSSEGPHLHFEIRETKTDVNINPMEFINVPDNITPTISHVAWYDRTVRTYEQQPSFIKIKKTPEGYTSVDSVIEIPTTAVSFGIIADDKSNTSSFQYGIYEANLQVDGNTLSQFKLDRISYDNSRYINACIDYSYKMQTGKYIQHLSRLSGNHLPFYFSTLKNDGVFNVTGDSIHQVVITIADFNGNSKTLRFKIKKVLITRYKTIYNSNWFNLFPNRSKNIDYYDARIYFPENTLYDTLNLAVDKLAPYNINNLSYKYSIGSEFIPLHSNITIQLKPNKTLSNFEKSKTIIQYTNSKSKEALKPIWTKDRAEINYNKLGNFQLLLDTTPPRITIKGITDSSNVSSTKQIIITANDSEGSVQYFNAVLDNKWLMFSRKGNNFVYTLDERCPPGYHTITCSIEDIAGNVSAKTISFFRDDEAVKKRGKESKNKKIKKK